MTHKFHNTIIWTAIFGCLLLLSASSALFAQVTFKFGVIDMGKVVEEYKKSKDANSLLKSEYKRLQQDIVKAEDQILELYERRDKASSLNEELVARMDSDIRIKSNELKKMTENHQKAISEREKELFEPILKEVDELIQQIGKEEKYDLIVRRPPVLYQAVLYGAPIIVLYADPKYDITDRVLKILNDKYDKEQSEKKKTKAKDEKKKADKEDNSKPEPVKK